MTLDVIIVSYGSGQLLERTVRTVMALKPDARVIVVDNGSPDVRQRNPRLGSEHTLIENVGNRGFAAAVNQGVSQGDSDIVLLLNPDVEAISSDFGHIEAAFADDPWLAAVTPRLVTTDGRCEPTRRRAPRPFDLLAETLDLAGRFPRWGRARRFRMLDEPELRTEIVDAATGACLFIRRTALADVGPFDEAFFVYWEETDWLVRAKQRGWSTLYLPTIEAVHAAGGSTDVSDDLRLLLLLEGQHIYSRKHFGGATAMGLRCLLAAVDAARLVTGFIPGRADVRTAMRRRLRVHLTGHAPRPRGSEPTADLR